MVSDDATYISRRRRRRSWSSSDDLVFGYMYGSASGAQAVCANVTPNEFYFVRSEALMDNLMVWSSDMKVGCLTYVALGDSWYEDRSSIVRCVVGVWFTAYFVYLVFQCVAQMPFVIDHNYAVFDVFECKWYAKSSGRQK